MIKHILFDLDGTLLPMVQDEFAGFYLPLLGKAFVKAGLVDDPKLLVKAVWGAFEKMVMNDGSRTNEEVFYENFVKFVPMDLELAKKTANDFYAADFNQAKVTTKCNPLSDAVIKAAKAKDIKVYLATNPVFPRVSTMNRIEWAGLDAGDFEIITTFEDNYYCKPNVKYFEEIMSKFELKPEECLMVGNDVAEDLVIRKLGVKTFLVTDTMENKKNLPIETDYQGSMADLLEFINKIN